VTRLASAGAVHAAPDTVAPFLLAVAVIVAVCLLCGALAAHLRQPPVVGEMLGGLLLGPSALGAVWPAAQHQLFPAAVTSSIGTVAQLGLVVFMFLLGCQLNRQGERTGRRAVAGIAIGGSALPFVGGLAVAFGFSGQLADSNGNHTAYLLFVPLALSVTAVPVLGRILLDRGLADSASGKLVLTSAALADGAAWGALTVILTVTGLGGHRLWVLGPSLVSLLAVLRWAVRPGLAALDRWADGRPTREAPMLPVILAGAIGTAAATQWLGLHPVIGAFLFGMVVPRNSVRIERMNHQLNGFTTLLLLPMFFTGVGMQVSVGAIGSDPMRWLLLVVVLVVAFAGKILGAGGGARLAGVSGPESLKLGVLMNCRGVTDLLVIVIGRQYHLISGLGFTLLVLMALVTTAATAPLLRLLSGGRDGSVDTGKAAEPDGAAATEEERLRELDQAIIRLVEERGKESVRLADDGGSGTRSGTSRPAREGGVLAQYRGALGRHGTDLAMTLIGIESECSLPPRRPLPALAAPNPGGLPRTGW